MDLFTYQTDKNEKNGKDFDSTKPLPDRMRPERLEEFFGQQHLVGEGVPFRRAIEKDALGSFILWGPPGTGKTTLARIVALHTERHFVILSAVTSGVKDIKEEVQLAKMRKSTQGKGTIVFVDEIHRFNKSQQDALLPHVEDGTFILIGATTENPSFELNSALLSRAPVFVLKSLDSEDIELVLKRALSDPKGLGALNLEFPAKWIQNIVKLSQGDARKGLMLLERVAFFLYHSPEKNFNESELDEIFGKAIGNPGMRYDATGEEHYNTISAFIKSMRDSDADAAVYYLARMLEGGEDPVFIARRMVIFASEDIGNADPRALQIALNVKEAVEFIGMPEARISLAHGVTYLSSAPKSNASYMAIEGALSEVKSSGTLSIPNHIKNAPTKLMKNLGYGKNYKYAHNYDDALTDQINLPDEIKDKRFYLPKDVGLEKTIAERMNQKFLARKSVRTK